MPAAAVSVDRRSAYRARCTRRDQQQACKHTAPKSPHKPTGLLALHRSPIRVNCRDEGAAEQQLLADSGQGRHPK